MSEKAHETLVTIEVKPSDVHKALESLGLKAGKPADVPNDKPAEGPELTVSLEFPREDGSTKKVPVSQLLIDMKTGKPLGKSVKFRFTGSELKMPDPNKPDTEYAADKSGTLIAVFPVTGKTVMPTLIDGHNHIGLVNEKDGSNKKANYTRENLIDQLQRYAYYGTAAAMSMGLEADQELAYKLRDEIIPNGAKFLTVGKGIAATSMAGLIRRRTRTSRRGRHRAAGRAARDRRRRP